MARSKAIASRSESVVDNAISRKYRKCPACKRLFANADTWTATERTMDTGSDPLASVEFHAAQLDAEGIPALQDAFFAFLDHDRRMPRTDMQRLIPYVVPGLLLLQATQPYSVGLLMERYRFKRSIRTLVQRYSMHHETLERHENIAKEAWRACVLDCYDADKAQAC